MFQIHYFDSNGHLLRVSPIIFKDSDSAIHAALRDKEYQKKLPKIGRFAYFNIVHLIVYP